MKDTLRKVSDLARISLQDLKQTFDLLKLVSLIDAMNRMSDEESSDNSLSLDIPMFGKLEVSKDFDFTFIPTVDFKKEIYQVQQNPEEYLKQKLKTLLKLNTVKGI